MLPRAEEYPIVGAYRGRFAPSPTGPLHFGSLVAAVASWCDARAAGGAWLLRIDDIDRARETPGAADAIVRTIERCGLAWDGPIVHQSTRTARHAAALERLRAGGHVYGCACTRREIADSALAGIEGPVYPGTCRGGLPPGRAARAERLRVEAARVAFDDLLQGRVEQDVAREVGDFVLRRADGLHAYQLAVVVDDAADGITHVVRGADLLASTPRQILLQRLLGYETPHYLHLPVAVDAQGRKLSKQTLAPAVDAADPAAVVAAALAFLGQPLPPPGERGDPAALLAWARSRWDRARLPSARAIAVPEMPGMPAGGSGSP